MNISAAIEALTDPGIVFRITSEVHVVVFDDGRFHVYPVQCIFIKVRTTLIGTKNSLGSKEVALEIMYPKDIQVIAKI